MLNAAQLSCIARRSRLHVLRQARARRSHIGSALSIIEILTALYFDYLRTGAPPSLSSDRDRFVLSKGHGALALYAVLHETGILSARILEGYGTSGNELAGHPSTEIPGVELGTGALGHGLAVGAGMAIATRIGGKSGRVLVLMGDGELNEGSVWEAALFCAHRRLSNLIAVIDRNRVQQEGPTEEILALEPLAEKWRAFGWRPVEVDGHDLDALSATFRAINTVDAPPTVVIANTVKGKGVSFMEHAPHWHMAQLDEATFARAIAEVEAHR